MNLRTVELGSTNLHLAEQGEGPLLLLLHGFPAFWYSWRDFLEPLSKKFQVVAPDLRGYNLSDKPEGVSQYSIEVLCEDLARLIRAMGHTRAYLVGHDWGGALAWACAALRPRLVNRVAVLNCPHPQAMAYHLRTNRRQLRRSWYILFFQLPFLPELILNLDRERFLDRAFQTRRPVFSQEDRARYRDAIFRPRVLTAAINYYRSAGRTFFSPPRYQKISAPSLLIWGEKDAALGRELTVGMERHFEGPYRVEYLPEAGHWVHNEERDRVLQLLTDFLVE